MITAIYTSVLALLMCGLAFNVIKARRKNKIRYADGNENNLLYHPRFGFSESSVCAI
jgi:uncharacterized protein